MGLEDEARRLDEADATRERDQAQAAREHAARLAELGTEFLAVVRKRGISPLPVHAITDHAGIWAYPTPEKLGEGWVFHVSEDVTYYDLILMADGTFKMSYQVKRLSAGKTHRTLGIARKYWPKGDFLAAYDSHDWSSVHIESIRSGMVQFLREN